MRNALFWAPLEHLFLLRFFAIFDNRGLENLGERQLDLLNGFWDLGRRAKRGPLGRSRFSFQEIAKNTKKQLFFKFGHFLFLYSRRKCSTLPLSFFFLGHSRNFLISEYFINSLYASKKNAFPGRNTPRARMSDLGIY